VRNDTISADPRWTATMRGWIYDRLVAGMTTSWYREVLSRLPYGARVLDVGIGTGSALAGCAEVVRSKDLQVVGTPTYRFACLPGWTYSEHYQLRYPVCVPPLRAHCTDPYRVTHRCDNCAFRVISNVLVSHVCDYDGRSCGPLDWPR
jgi:hypothetical protein